jgi:hypothetical protein
MVQFLIHMPQRKLISWGICHKVYGSSNGSVYYTGDPKVLTSRFSQRHPIDYWGCNSWSNYDGDITENFLLLLFAAQHASPNSSFVLAFEEHGLVFFAPKDVNVGDIVCQFPGSDILTVAEVSQFENPSPSRLYVTIPKMRRAVNFLASAPSAAVDICGKLMSFEGARSYCLRVEAERDFIRELCRVSKTPNGEHNIFPIQGEIEGIGGLKSREKENF